METQQQEFEVAATGVTQDEADESAGFSASFDGASEAPPVEQEESRPEEDAAAPEEQEAGAEEAHESTVPGVNEQQLLAMLAKLPKIDEVEQMTAAEIRKLHGKFGEVNRALQELRSSGTQHARLNVSNLKRVAENYPELAEMLAEDLSESGASASQVDVDALVNQRVNERLQADREEMDRKMQVSLLTIQHRDWMKLKDSAEFGVWAQTLPQEEQQQLAETWDATYLGDKFTEFKEWLGKRTQGADQRKERLQRAVAPKGGAPVVKPGVMTEEDGFAAAFSR